MLKAARKEPFPWWPFLLLLLTLGLFWVLPHRMGDPPVQVDFTASGR